MIPCATVTFWCIEIVSGLDAENRRQQIAGLAADLPPALVPRAHARLVPRIGIFPETLARGAGIAPSE